MSQDTFLLRRAMQMTPILEGIIAKLSTPALAVYTLLKNTLKYDDQKEIDACITLFQILGNEDQALIRSCLSLDKIVFEALNEQVKVTKTAALVKQLEIKQVLPQHHQETIHTTMNELMKLLSPPALAVYTLTDKIFNREDQKEIHSCTTLFQQILEPKDRALIIACFAVDGHYSGEQAKREEITMLLYQLEAKHGLQAAAASAASAQAPVTHTSRLLREQRTAGHSVS